VFGWFRKRDDWGDLPKSLGLQVDGRGLLRGEWGVVELFASHTTERVSSTDARGVQRHDDFPVTWIYARFEPKLRLGLSVASTNALTRFVEWARSSCDLEIGEPAFDRAFHCAARDPAGARSLLSGEVAVELARAASRHAIVTVNDDEVCVTEAGWRLSPATVASAFEVVGRSAEAIMASRRGLVLPWEMQVREHWDAALARVGLVFDPVRLEARGVIDGLFVTVTIDGGDSLATEVTVVAPAPFAHGLRVLRQDQGSVSKWFRGQDIIIGEPAFDDAFVVKGENEPEVRAVLRGEPAARLVALANDGEVHIENNALTVRFAQVETDQIAALVEATVEAASLIARNASGFLG
jgi:hypothetical protein